MAGLWEGGANEGWCQGPMFVPRPRTCWSANPQRGCVWRWDSSGRKEVSTGWSKVLRMGPHSHRTSVLKKWTLLMLSARVQRKSHVCKPRTEFSPAAKTRLWFWTPSLQNSEKIQFCGICPPVCGIFLQRPELTNTHGVREQCSQWSWRVSKIMFLYSGASIYLPCKYSNCKVFEW